MLEVIERILAAVIVLAIASLLIFITARSMGITDGPPEKTVDGGGTQPQTQPQPQPEKRNGAKQNGETKQADQKPPVETKPPVKQTAQQRQQPTSQRPQHQPVAQQDDGGGSSFWPWNWRWRWPCPTGTRPGAQGGCYEPAVYQQPVYRERPYYAPPTYYERRPYYEPPPDRRGYYHPEADPYGRYDRDDPYLECEGDEGCRRRQPCIPNYGYYDRPAPCTREGCRWRPYWQRESYRASFGYAPYRSIQGDPLPCD